MSSGIMSNNDIQITPNFNVNGSGLPSDITGDGKFMAKFDVVGTGGGVSKDYNTLIHKPQINGVELAGNKSFDDLSLKTITTLELINILK